MYFTYKQPLQQFSDDELIAELSRRDDERNHEEVVQDIAVQMILYPDEVRIEEQKLSDDDGKMTYIIEVRK